MGTKSASTKDSNPLVVAAKSFRTTSSVTFISAAILVAAAIAVALLVQHQNRDEIGETVIAVGELTIQPSGQLVDERTWHSTKAERLRRRTDGGTMLFQPLAVRGDSSGVHYILDYGDTSIKEIDTDGNVAYKWGNGFGEGPGEFLNVTDFRVASDRRMWVLDGSNRKLTRFNPDGSVFNTVTFPHAVIRLAVREDRSYYTIGFGMKSNQSSGLFDFFDLNDSLITSFGQIVEDQAISFLTLDGSIVSVGDDVVYSPYYHNFIARYSDTGELIYARATIETGDRSLALASRSVEDGTGYRLRDGVKFHSELSYSDGNLFVVALNDSKSTGQTILDVYDAEDGDYEYSFSLDEMYPRAAVALPFVFAVGDTSEVVFTFDSGQD